MTRGFPSPSFDEFGFIADANYTPVLNLGISPEWVWRIAKINRLDAFFVALIVNYECPFWDDNGHRRWIAANGDFRAGSGRLYRVGISRQVVSVRPISDIQRVAK